MLDLTLARTYVPVCICAVKICLLCSFMAFLGAVGVPGQNMVVIVGTVLVLDRLLSREFIFESNTVVCLVFASLVINQSRDGVGGERAVFGITLDVLWAAVALSAPFKPEAHFPVFQYIPYNPLIITAFMLALHSFIPMPTEMVVWTFLRVFNFFVFSMAWIYVVNVENSFAHTTQNCMDCFVYFGHILYMSLPAASVSTFAVSIMLMLYSRHTREPDEVIKIGSSDTAESSGERTPPATSWTVTDEQEDLEAVFREAKARMQTSFAVQQQRM